MINFEVEPDELHNALALARDNPDYVMALTKAMADGNSTPLVRTVSALVTSSIADPAGEMAQYLRECGLMPLSSGAN